MSIPQFRQNRTVSIRRNKPDNSGTYEIVDRDYLILTEDISMSTSISYKTIGELNRKVYDLIKDMLSGFDLAKIFEGKGGTNSFKTVLDTIDFLYEAGGYLPSVKYVQAYKVAVGQEPLRFTLPFSFNFGYRNIFSGYWEVYYPIIELIKGLSSQYSSKENNSGLKLVGLNYFEHLQSQLQAMFNTGKEFISEVGSFVSSLPFFSNSSGDNKSDEERRREDAEKEELAKLRERVNHQTLYNKVEELQKKVGGNERSSGTLEVTVGRLLKFSRCNVTDLNYSFSSDVDSEGYPISGRISIGFETLAPFGVGGNVIEFVGERPPSSQNNQQGRR